MWTGANTTGALDGGLGDADGRQPERFHGDEPMSAQPRMQVVLRLDAAINTAVRAAARKEQLSLNAYCQTVLARAVARHARSPKPVKPSAKETT
jgi:hypothetical protein